MEKVEWQGRGGGGPKGESLREEVEEGGGREMKGGVIGYNKKTGERTFDPS